MAASGIGSEAPPAPPGPPGSPGTAGSPGWMRAIFWSGISGEGASDEARLDAVAAAVAAVGLAAGKRASVLDPGGRAGMGGGRGGCSLRGADTAGGIR